MSTTQYLGRSIGCVLQHEDMLHDHDQQVNQEWYMGVNERQFSQSSRLFNILVPAHS
jgi:hypothetical protein